MGPGVVVDPLEEALARAAIGDELVDQALEALEGLPVIEERLELDVQRVFDQAAGRRDAAACRVRSGNAA